MTNNLEFVAIHKIEVTEHVKRHYVAPTLIELNETSIQGGPSANMPETSNGGAFTNAS